MKAWEAAEIMGVTDRTMRRWRERLKEQGYSGLWDYRKRRPSPKRVPMAIVEQVLRLYQEQYFDFNVRHFYEKLGDEHGIALSYGWVKTALQTAGLCLQTSGIYRFLARIAERERARSGVAPNPGTELAPELLSSSALFSTQVFTAYPKIVALGNRTS